MPAPSYTTLNVQIDHPGIFTITLSRPDKLNALNATVLQEFQDALSYAKTSSSIKAVLITGQGEKAFCAGADIEQLVTLNSQQGHAFSKAGQTAFRMLEQLGKPSLAAINGYAFGGGFELAMAATLRIAVDSARLALPEVKLGLIPGYGGTQRLARLAGKGRALDLCITGRMLDAHTALSWGILSEVTPTDQLLSSAYRLLSLTLAVSPLAVKSAMEVIDSAYDLPLQAALEIEAEAFGKLCGMADKKEGVDAFLNKRPPHFVDA